MPAQPGSLKFNSLPAWGLEPAEKILQLLGFRNRLPVLINRAWAGLFTDHAVRLIVPEKPARALRLYPEPVQWIKKVGGAIWTNTVSDQGKKSN